MSYCRVFECVVDRSGLTKQFVGLLVDEARRRAEVSIPLFVFPFVSHVLISYSHSVQSFPLHRLNPNQSTARTRNRRAQKGRQGRCRHLWQIGPLLPRRRHLSTQALTCQEAQSTQSPSILHSWHRLHPLGWSIPWQARGMSQGPRIRITPGHWSVQNKWCTIASCQPSLCYWNIYEN